jgi:hypothetical protein
MSNVTPKQALIMWCLLARHGQALQGELVPKVEKKDREALLAAGYISFEKLGQAFFLKVEDRGWHWAGEHLRHDLPKNYLAMQNLFSRLDEFLERSGTTLADFIGSAPETPPQPVKKAKQKPSRGTASKKRSKSRTAKHKHAPEDVRARIERAYLQITNGRKAQGVLLSKVRAQLSDLDRKTVDDALLRILGGDPNARLGQISDPKALSQEDLDAAFSPGGEAFHLLWIQP